jgi:glycosyltransferase involved in cell wall biosynthesis
MPKLNVLTLIDRPSFSGGGERLAAQVAMSLDPTRFERILCSTRPAEGPVLDRELEDAGVELLRLDRRSTLDLPAWRPLLSLLRERPVDVLHAHKFGSNLWGSLLGRLANVPVVVAHEHTWSFEGNAPRRLLDRAVVSRRADVLIAVSREDRRKLIEVEGIPPERVRFVPNGIPAVPLVDRAEARRALGLDLTGPVVVAVCELRPQKAVEVLVRAAALLQPELRDLAVLVAGDGPERQALERLIGETDAPVKLLGTRTDVPQLLGAADVAVLSSDFEGSPLSVMEYMAAARPVVATAVGGVPDLVEDGVHGLLVPTRDEQALAGALRSLVADPERARALGERGRERQQREFTLEAMVDRLELLYESLYAASVRGRARAEAP